MRKGSGRKRRGMKAVGEKTTSIKRGKNKKERERERDVRRTRRPYVRDWKSNAATVEWMAFTDEEHDRLIRFGGNSFQVFSSYNR